MPKYLRRGPRMNPSSKASMVSRPNANLYTSPISKDKRFYSASLPEETVKFSDASEAHVCIPICVVA